jgi:hypothetical protein
MKPVATPEARARIVRDRLLVPSEHPSDFKKGVEVTQTSVTPTHFLSDNVTQ